MKVRKANSYWKGDLRTGNGEMSLGSTDCIGKYSFMSRFEDGKGTNPEELIAAAHSGCFSMALANIIAGKGFNPENINTTAYVTLEKGEQGFGISNIKLECKATVPGIDDKTFQELALDAKKNCPVSRALASVNITLEAELVK